MRLLPRPRRVPFPVATRTRDREPYRQYHPRLGALDLLREKIAAGQAGLDPYQPSDFIIVAGPNEVVWAARCADLCGQILTRARLVGGGERIRVVLEADARHELGLDTSAPPLMLDEPLASRAVDERVYTGPTGLTDAVGDVVPEARPLLQVVPGEPLALAALRSAKHAAALSYDCQCGAPAGLACKCSDDTRIATPREAS